MNTNWRPDPVINGHLATVDGHNLRVWQSGSLWVAAMDGDVVGRCATEREAKRMASNKAQGREAYQGGRV